MGGRACYFISWGSEVGSLVREHLSRDPKDLRESCGYLVHGGSKMREDHMQRSCGLSLLGILMEQLREAECLEGSEQRGKVVGDGVGEVWGQSWGLGERT